MGHAGDRGMKTDTIIGLLISACFLFAIGVEPLWLALIGMVGTGLPAIYLMEKHNDDNQ